MKPLSKHPHARNGKPFQLPHADLVHQENVQNPSDVHNSAQGEGGGVAKPQDKYRDTPPPPSPHKEDVHNLPALYGDPANRETLRRKLVKMEISSVNKLLRTFTAAQLVEAINDYEREVELGGDIRSPDSFLWWLLR